VTTLPSISSKYNTDSALARAIMVVGIGKHGSKSLSDEMVADCLSELASDHANELQKGVLFGALMIKGLAKSETGLEHYLGKGAFNNPVFLLNKLCPDLPAQLFPIGVKLLSGHSLQVSEAEQLGHFLLYTNRIGDSFRGLATSILRVRYETNDEYKGLYEAASKSYTPGFQRFVKTKLPIVQLAEPFDGVVHSYLITPLVAQFFQDRHYNAVSSVGRTSGPKYGLNAYDLYLYLGSWLLQNNHELLEKKPTFGWVLDQKALSPQLDNWVERRRSIIKRPFLATLEKVLNPCGARILVTSVFHITYQMKMAELALMAGFDGVMVLKRGLEGSIAPSTSRESGLLCAARNQDNHISFTRIDSNCTIFQSFKTDSDEQIDNLTVEQNAKLIRNYYNDNKTDNPAFDNQVSFAKVLYMKGLDWIESQIGQ
jgi:anthranilate phosphoribosyltransferase